MEDLERVLKALANVNRIQLLLALQKPSRMTEIDLKPSRSGPWGAEDRAISRQAVRAHVDALREIGVVDVLDEESATPRYVVNHARLYEVTESLREMATIRAVVDVQDETVARGAEGNAVDVKGPRLVLVRGVREGQAFALAEPAPSAGWLIGRHRDADVSLDYDPFVSSAHSRVVAKDGRHFLVDLRENRNGTLLNWRPMARGGIAPLEPGDLVGVGSTVLLYRR